MPLLYFVIPILISGAGLLVAYFSLKQGILANKIGAITFIIGTISTIAIVILIWPNNDTEKFDIINYYEDGTIHYTGNGNFEDREDTWKWYSKGGILIKIETYDDNILDGEYKEFYMNGNIKMDCEYDDGQKDLSECKCYGIGGEIKECGIKK